METIRIIPSAGVDGRCESLMEEIMELSEFDPGSCYQCGKCSAGCPVAFVSDYTPRQVIRLLQMGLVEEALRSKVIWLCTTCSTCATRCPRAMDIPGLFDALKIVSKKKGLASDEGVGAFNDLFLGSVESNGRIHEMGLALGYSLKSHKPPGDLGSGVRMFLAGKLKLLPERIRGRNDVKRIFEGTVRHGGVHR